MSASHGAVARVAAPLVRLAGRLALCLAACLALCAAASAAPGCAGSAAETRATASKTDALIAIDCPVADAELWVDDRFVANIGSLRRGIRLGPGRHRVEVRHDQYHARYLEIEVSARERRTLRFDLAEILP